MSPLAWVGVHKRVSAFGMMRTRSVVNLSWGAAARLTGCVALHLAGAHHLGVPVLVKAGVKGIEIAGIQPFGR